MGTFEKLVHSFIISMGFSVLTWFIVNHFIIDISIYKYFAIEILLLVMLKGSLFLQNKLGVR